MQQQQHLPQAANMREPLQSPQQQQHQQQPTSGRKLSGSTGGAGINPNNKRGQEWPDIPEIGKIDEENPEILARKILETGRQIEAVKYGAELTPRAGSASSCIIGTPPVETTTKRPQSEKSSRSRAKATPVLHKAPATANKESPTPPAQVAPPNAESTPRVNDFEDRLKNLITSVLNDNSNKPNSTSSTMSSSPIPPPSSESKASFTVPKEPGQQLQQQREGLFARAPLKFNLATHNHAQSQPDYTQFSPAKLALRRHLSQERLHSPQQMNNRNADMNYIRTVGDLVTGEIERSLERNMERSSVASPSGSFHHSYSPISRPASTDSVALPVMPMKDSNPDENAVEGLAASLRDSIRTPAEEMTSTDIHPLDKEEASSTPTTKKKRRPSVDAIVDQPKEKSRLTQPLLTDWPPLRLAPARQNGKTR